MAKKTTKLKEVVEAPKSFEQLCLEFREKKIALKIAEAATEVSKANLHAYVVEHNLGKGNYSGVQIQEKFSFSTTNVDIAIAAKITIPMIVTQELKLSEERVQQLIQKGILKADEVVKTEVPNFKALEKLMEEKKVTTEYIKSYSYGLSAQ